MTRRRVAVLMGGMSSEHEVSVASGTKVTQSLDRNRYDVTPVLITKEGTWRFSDDAPLDLYEALPELKRRGVDCAFIALHGAFGEDGRIQGMLDMLGVPYTSSGCAASGLAIDKLRSKAIVAAAGVRVAPYRALSCGEWEADADGVMARIAAEYGFPCVLKSPCQGSSVGMAIVRDEAGLRGSIEDVFAYGGILMIEKFVHGPEVTCAVLDVEPSKRAVALPVTEIRPVSSEFFDYHAKYTPGASIEITPAEISPELTRQVQEMSVLAHEIVGCDIWSRNDFIIDEVGPVWLEVNTVPGMTGTSLYPQAAAAAGISYEDLVGLFVEAAIAKQGRTQKG
jgi:D-alanine-D-alanine ligase